MDSSQTTTLAVGVLALVASVVMAWRAVARQRAVRAQDKERQKRRFTRRRLVMSALVALVGVALTASAFFTPKWCAAHPRDVTYFWLGVIGALIVLLALAVADAFAVLNEQIVAHYKSENWEDIEKKIRR